MQRVGSYEIVRTLARGGMAVVYLARQPALDRDVALKQLELEGADPVLAQRFVREARLAAALDHPNVVTLFDFFEDGGVPYIAMEFVPGGTLRPLVGSLRLPQVIGVLEGILAGLRHAERLGIAHRDLKPENVLLTRGGGVKLADFGIARAYDALTKRLTSTGSAIGTPMYMAPEQALSEPLGPYTDVYAVGVMAYELLAGRPPFDPHATPVAILYCHVHKQPPPLADLAPEVPRPVCDWVDWLLTKAPDERPRTAAEAWDALEEIAVSGLGPYWRRASTITMPGLAAVRQREEVTPDEELPTTAHTVAERTRVMPQRVTPPEHDGAPGSRRRPAAFAAAATLAAALAAAAVALIADGADEPRQRTTAAKRVRAAAPYDFDGDGRQELVIGMPGSGGRGDGVVLVRRRPARRGSATLITPRATGIEPRAGGDFGASVASADFDRDGRADLAIGDPGRDMVAVRYGDTADGRGRVERLRAPASAAGRYGSALLAADFDGDGYADLAVGAPGADDSSLGTARIVPGSGSGLRRRRARTLRRPEGSIERFGSRMRAGDVDRDGNLDIVEGAADRPGRPGSGHGSYCPGSAKGPERCRALAGGGTSGLAVADVDGDRYDDVIQGDAVDERLLPVGFFPPLVPTWPGEVRVWLGGRRGPASQPVTITQGDRGIPGNDEPGDAFGSAVEAGDLDGDGKADMLVAARGEDGGAGAITVIRGGRGGHARVGHGGFSLGATGLPGVPRPGSGFAQSLALLQLTGDDRLDLAVTIAGADRLDRAVIVIQGGPGAFEPSERKSSAVTGLARRVRRADIGEIRLGRAAGG